ncbi:MAG TPA: MMPL family transporter [Gaiellaceae bacterium]|nr:MMPL family transporter [Gaiellaceae bacterium]
MSEPWTRLVLRLRVPVLVGWGCVLVIGLVASTRLSRSLATSFDVPGTASQRASSLLAKDFGEQPEGTFTVVFAVGHPSDPVLQKRLRRRIVRAASFLPHPVVGATQTGGGIVFADVATSLDLRQAKGLTSRLRARLAGSPRAYVTGEPAIQGDLDPILAGDLRRGEELALPLTLAVLVAVFGVSLAVFVPLVVAACTITATLAVVWLLAHEISMATYVGNLVELVGLGLAVDYSLLILHRFREELAFRPCDDAVVETMRTSGRAVVFSAVAVAIGLGVLLVVPVPFVRSMGIGGLLIPLVSLAAAVTLQPALLSIGGTRLAGRSHPGAVWERLARAVTRRPLRFLAAGGAMLLALAVPAAWLRVTPGSITGIPSSAESVQGYQLLKRGLGAGVVTPTHVVIAPAAAAAANRLVHELVHEPEVLLVAHGDSPPYTGDGAQQVIVANRHEWGDDATRRFVVLLRDRLIPGAHFPAGTEVVAGGAPPQGVDFVDRLYGAFPWVVGAVLAFTFVVLMRAFRSLLVPLKAVLLNLVCVGASYGAITLLFRHPIEAWIPVFLFAALFGLSMDYEVFLVSRMREAHESGEADADAVALGLKRTGRVVTAAAAIMVIAFSSFAVGRIEGLREFGVGLAIAVALDATVVRALLVPSAMAILGPWNWWLPSLRRERA